MKILSRPLYLVIFQVLPLYWPNACGLTRCHHDTSQELGLVAVSPVVQASHSLRYFDNMGGELDLTSLVDTLNAQVELANCRDLSQAGAMLVSQAVTLNAIFNSLAIRSARNMGEGYMEATETYMRLALKAQTQARSTWVALSDIQNSTMMVKQANIAHNQQVNNGTIPVLSGTEDNEIPQNQILEVINESRMDTRTTGTAVKVDSELEAVGKDKRCRNRGRKKAVIP